MEKSERIRQLIPSIDKIDDQKLRDAVIRTWVIAWEESEWEDVADCPFHPEITDCNLIQHTNFVIQVSLAMASCAQENWHIPVDINLLLAGAILHDVSKVLEHSPLEGRPGKQSAIGQNLVHGTYGVHLALNAGLPLSVAHLISTHTPQVNKSPKTIEGIFISYADYTAADIFLLRKEMPLLLSTVKLP